MNYLKIIALILCFIAQINGASKYNKDDEDHPYEFGFTIDQQQHRHESKDVNGIIQGEFGFITADGIYHTTVYATDENGNFKILSMRNVRVSPPLDQLDAKIDSFQKKQTATPPPTAPTARPQRTTSSPPVQPQQQPQYHPQSNPQSLQPQNQPYQPPNQPQNQPPNQPYQPPNQPQNQAQFPSVAITTTTRRPHPVFTTQRTEKPACAGCGYVTTPKPIPGQPQKLPFFQLSFDNPGSQIIGPKPVQSNTPTTVQQGQGQIIGQYPVQNNPSSTAQGQNPVHRNPSTTSQEHTGFNKPLLGAPHNGLIAPPHSATGVNYNPNQGHPNQPNTQFNGPSTTFNQPSPQVPPSFGNPDGSIPPFNPNPAVGIANIPSVPITDNKHDIGRPIRDDIKVTDGFIKVPNNEPIKIKDKYPGMVDGLPPGVTQNDITDLLYRFNYTVGFHGHYEKGYKNGAKVGGYFVNDRDGVSRIVTYVADENGYRPKVKFIRLNLDSDDVPKEGSEKKFGLKNFEFVWYPIK